MGLGVAFVLQVLLDLDELLFNLADLAYVFLLLLLDLVRLILNIEGLLKGILKIRVHLSQLVVDIDGVFKLLMGVRIKRHRVFHLLLEGCWIQFGGLNKLGALDDFIGRLIVWIKRSSNFYLLPHLIAVINLLNLLLVLKSTLFKSIRILGCFDLLLLLIHGLISCLFFGSCCMGLDLLLVGDCFKVGILLCGLFILSWLDRLGLCVLFVSGFGFWLSSSFAFDFFGWGGWILLVV